MKELLTKLWKFVSAAVGILVAAYTVGWSGAVTLHNMFKAEKAEAERFVIEQVSTVDAKWSAIRTADLDGIHGKMDILIGQNNLIISQNYRTRKLVESQTNSP